MKYQYDKLRQIYNDFESPILSVTVEGKRFEDNNAGMIIGEFYAELTSGLEAAEAVYRIYNCTDLKDGTYLSEELKPYILLGSYTVIEAGYEGAVEEVFRGYVASVEFACSEEEIPCASVTIMDIKGVMMGNIAEKQLRAVSWGEAVKEILKGQSCRGLAREFETRGMDDRKGELISCKKKSADKLSSGNRVNAVLSGTAKVCIDASVRSQPEVQARTEALAEKTAWSFGRLECECIGIPVLKPGYFVEMAGFGKGVDNQFYINKVRHELSGEKGYRTLLSGQAASVGES